MIRKLILVFTVFTLSMVGVFSVYTSGNSKSKIVIVATDATWPPMEYVDENRNIVGFDIDMMNAIAKEGGFQIAFQNHSWDGIFAGLAAGKYDVIISSVSITDERQKIMDFSMPYVNCGQVIVVKKNLNGMDSLTQFTGKKVGAQTGTTGSFEVKKIDGIILKEYDSIDLAIEDLANGVTDAVVCDLPVAANYIRLNKKYKDVLKTAGQPFTMDEYAIAVVKGNKAILDQINKGLMKVKEKKIDQELEKKWLK